MNGVEGEEKRRESRSGNFGVSRAQMQILLRQVKLGGGEK
jgi:hypothetical protein